MAIHDVTKKNSGATLCWLAVCSIFFIALTGCSKPPVTITLAQLVESLDKGSGNFDRVLRICFSEPLRTTYYHKVAIVTKEDVKIFGEGILRPLASDPNSKCHLRNVYAYINKDSPVEARQLIKDYVVSGNIRELLIKVYDEKPKGKGLPIAEMLFLEL